MALFHLHVTQVKRSAGQSVVTSAAYRAGEKLYSEYYTNFVALIVGQFPYAFTIRKNLRLLDIIFAILVAEHLR